MGARGKAPGSSGSGEVVGTLTRDRIVGAAMDLAQRAGIDALTMRRLADELGVTPMAAYRHVSGKDDLVQAMTERVWAEVLALPFDELPDDPSELVVAALVQIRRHLLSYGDLARVVAWRPTPSQSVAASVAAIVDVLRSMGFSDEQVPAVYATIVGVALGQIQFEVARADFEQATELPRPTGLPDDVEVDAASRVVVEQIGAAPDRAALFEFTIRRLVAGLLVWGASGEPPPDLTGGQ